MVEHVVILHNSFITNKSINILGHLVHPAYTRSVWTMTKEIFYQVEVESVLSNGSGWLILDL